MRSKPKGNDLKSEEARTRETLDRAAKGDESALSTLRQIFDQKPMLAEQTGDLARQAEESWLRAALGDNLTAREAVKRKLEKLKAELAGPSASPLERLLVDQIAVCWLHVHYAEVSYAQRMGDLGTEWGNFYQKRIDRAQRRYLSAIKTLAAVRRLQLPAVQVNIGDKQVNLVAPSGRLPAEECGEDEIR